MKQDERMSGTVRKLEKMYHTINADKFGGQLPVPIITVQSKPGTYGHCSTAKIWKQEGGEAYELNIAAEMLNAPIEETLDTMIHEMVHLYCRENGIQEVSRGGAYHNGRFKDEAERRGLECVKGKNGWNTRPGDAIRNYAKEKGWTQFTLHRETLIFGGIRTGTSGGAAAAADGGKGGKKPSSTRKLQCPCCGNSVRATKAVRIMCMDCMEQMTEA